MAFKIKLNDASGVPYYKQIIDQITYAIINKMVKPGEKLPTVRQLAVDLQINLNTVIKAYKELEIKGIVSTQQGTGTYISETQLRVNKEEKTALLKSRCLYFTDELTALGINLQEAIKMLQRILKEREVKKNDTQNQLSD